MASLAAGGNEVQFTVLHMDKGSLGCCHQFHDNEFRTVMAIGTSRGLYDSQLPRMILYPA